MIVSYTPREYAERLVATFGIDLAYEVVELLLDRDRKWMHQLATFPNRKYKVGDEKKSEALFESVREELRNINQIK